MLLLPYSILAQCDNYQDENLSPKIANYNIHAELDRTTHAAHAKQIVTWKNTSPDPISELRFYMYMNGFMSKDSPYVKSLGDFAKNIDARSPSEFGYISVTKISRGDTDLTDRAKYIQPDNENKKDKTVLSLQLAEPIPAGESIELEMDFISKLPRTFVRAGYGKNDFNLFVHWFPQLGVYEQNIEGIWGWNCHQFLPKTEFYADFGNYDVTLVTDEDFIVGATGCRTSEQIKDGKKTSRFTAYDVIDFGWTAYPLYEVYTDVHEGTEIELLIPSEHCAMAPRYISTIKSTISFLEKNVGKYHYPKITLVDPPVHTLTSGFMEYPMMVTLASVYGTPRRFRGSESLAIHEFTHMYFMGMLANNEKEEAWLDEGFVTFYEDEILDHLHGEKRSFYDFGGIRTGNAQKSRQEYTTLKYPMHEIIAKPGWENKGYFKALVYGKMATSLRTFKGIIGEQSFTRIIKHYFEENKFTHPREADWLAAIDTMLSAQEKEQFDYKYFFNQALHTANIVDFEIVTVDNSKQSFTVKNKGEFNIPNEILVAYKNGKEQYLQWDGKGEKTFQGTGEILSVYVDPEHKVLLDLNYINNSYTTKPSAKSTVKHASYGAMVGEIFLNIVSFLLL